MARVQITNQRIEDLGEKISRGQQLDTNDQELLVSTFSLAGEAITNRAATSTAVAQPSRLSQGLLGGFKGSLGPQVGTGPNPAALDVGVDVNVNW